MASFFSKEPLYHYAMDYFLAKSHLIYKDSNIIIHVGGGPNRNHPKEINLNIFKMPNVDVVGDAANIPLKDGSADVIISNAVLEHVKDLEKILAEIKRVLKEGGLLYVEVPFIQHYHTDDSYGVKFEDYRRLTKEGLKCLFSECYETIDVGICVGPTSAVLQITFTYLEDMFLNKVYRKIIRALYYFFGNIFCRIDLLLSKSLISRSRIPSGVYYFGKKL